MDISVVQTLLTGYDPTRVASSEQPYPLEAEEITGGGDAPERGSGRGAPRSKGGAGRFPVSGGDAYYEDFQTGLDEFVRRFRTGGAANPAALVLGTDTPDDSDDELDADEDFDGDAASDASILEFSVPFGGTDEIPPSSSTGAASGPVVPSGISGGAAATRAAGPEETGKGGLSSGSSMPEDPSDDYEFVDGDVCGGFDDGSDDEAGGDLSTPREAGGHGILSAVVAAPELEPADGSILSAATMASGERRAGALDPHPEPSSGSHWAPEPIGGGILGATVAVETAAPAGSSSL